MTDTPERDVVERLREQAKLPGAVCLGGGFRVFKLEDSLEWEAADTITSLRAQLREARAKAFEEAAGIAAEWARQLDEQLGHVMDGVPKTRREAELQTNLVQITAARRGTAQGIEESIHARAQQQIGAEREG